MMDDLLVKYLAEEATPPEEELVDRWIASSEANRRYFQHFQQIWLQSRQLAFDTPTDEIKAWQKFQHRVRKEEQLKKKRPAFGWWSIAASIIIVAGAAWFTSTILFKGTRDPQILTITSTNEVIKDTMPDGSLATLNKHSAISYPEYFKEKTRKVKLQGEAFFLVKPNKQKPFIIEVNDVVIKVVGTSFNVKSDDGKTEVIVETGLVQVRQGSEIVELQAGERTVLSATGRTLLKEASNDKLYNYYVSKTFVCDGTPLWKLVEKLNEAYNVNIHIERESLRKLPLTVTFDDESLDTILDIIAQTLLLKVSKKDGKIVLH